MSTYPRAIIFVAAIIFASKMGAADLVDNHDIASIVKDCDERGSFVLPEVIVRKNELAVSCSLTDDGFICVNRTNNLEIDLNEKHRASYRAMCLQQRVEALST